MERILDFNKEFDANLFDEIVGKALDSTNPNKNEAERILLKFKEDSNSWLRVDAILTSSRSIQAKFIGLQILNDNINSKWQLLGEETRSGIRQYVFDYIIKNANTDPNDIILKKFNAILVGIVKKDWPKKIPNFVPDLISISKSTSMAVCSNSLIILRMVNEEVFHGKEEITTVKRNILKDAVRQEYSKIFSLIQNILEYSENADVDNALLVNCFNCLISYCRDMDPQYIFSTRIVEMIIAHLNSAHAVLVLRSLLSICDLFEPLEITEKLDERTLNIPQGLNKETVFAKINLIHRELIMFFKTYLGKFSPDSSLEKEYSLFSDEEKSFIKQITQLFVSIYKNYHPYIPDSILIESLEQFIEISKINDLQLFKETLNGWEVLIYDFYIEYPIRPVPDGKIRRFKFKTILQKMINVFVKFIPKPEKVFVTLNEFQEAVKVKEFTTEEMVFSKRMNQTFFNLTFCIDNHVKDFFLVTFNRIGSNSEKFDPVYLNKVCWAYGSTAGAFESDVEERIFMIACKSLMSLCSIILHRTSKIVISSNIMFIISQYESFLRKFHDFTYVVFKKLFEFMRDDYEGIKIMVVETFSTICEKAPESIFKRDKNVNIIEDIVLEMPAIHRYLELPHQRDILESLFKAILSAKVNSVRIVRELFNGITNNEKLEFNFNLFQNNKFAKYVIHIIECYKLGFKYLSNVFGTNYGYEDILSFYHGLVIHGKDPKISTFADIINKSMLSLFMVIVENANSNEFISKVIPLTIMEYENVKFSETLELSQVILLKSNEEMYIQRFMLILNNVIVPSIDLVNDGDKNPDVAIAYLNLIKTILEDETGVKFQTNFHLLMSNAKYPSIITSVLTTMGCMKEISDNSLILLKLIFNQCYKAGIYQFFITYTITTIENILGILFDKDTRQNKMLQIDLLYDLINISNNIPLLQSDKTNQIYIINYLDDLFKEAFNNVTSNSKEIFYRGLFGIKNKELFADHVKDFIVKVHEYGSDDELNEEMQLLNERMDK